MSRPAVAFARKRAQKAPSAAATDAALGARGTLLVVAATWLSALPSLLWRFGRDQGIYAYTAWAWRQGEALYRDVYVFKPPGTVFVHALAQELFGPHQVSIRLLDAGLQAATAVMLGALVATWSRSRSTGLWAGLLYGPAYYAYGFWHTSQTDGWFNPLAVAALLLVTRARPGRALVASSVLAGLLVGVAVVLKYTALALALPLLLALFLAPRGDRTGRECVLAAGAALVALPVPLLATFGWMAATGLFDSYVESQRLVLGYAANTMSFAWRRLLTQPELRVSLGLGIAGALAAVVLAATGRRPRGLPIWGAWLVAATASLASQGRFFEYHSLPLVPLFAWAGGVFAGPVAERLRGRWRVLSAALFLVPLLVAAPPATWGRVASALAEAGAARLEGRPPERTLGRFERVAQVIREHTDPDETVYVWSYDPAVLFLAQRRQVSRFLYNYPMVVAWQDGRARAELMAELRAAPPALFAVGSRDAAMHVTQNPQDSRRSFESFVELRDWVHAHYVPLTQQDGFQFFVRRDRAARPDRRE